MGNRSSASPESAQQCSPILKLNFSFVVGKQLNLEGLSFLVICEGFALREGLM